MTRMSEAVIICGGRDFGKRWALACAEMAVASKAVGAAAMDLVDAFRIVAIRLSMIRRPFACWNPALERVSDGR